jgi:signal transduction histidine kinase
MALQLGVYVPILFLATALCVALAAYAWGRRDAPGAVPLTGLLLGMAAWAGFYGLGLLTDSLALRVLWLRLNWLGSGFVPLFWLLFAAEYAGREEWLTPWRVGGLAAVPVATAVLAWTTPFHDLMWRNMTIEDLGAVTIIRYDTGLWYTVFDAYTYLLIGAATVVLLGLVVRYRDLYTDQAIALLLGSFLPAVGYAAVYSGLVRDSVDLTPLTFPLTGLAFGYTMFRGDLLATLTPTSAVGEEAAVASMQDGVVVVDGDGGVIETNRAARELLGDDFGGRPLADVPVLRDLALDGGERTVERTSPENRTLEVTVTPITDAQGTPIGHSLVLRDVTEQRRAHQRRQVSNRILRHNLRNDMNVVIGNADIIANRTDDETLVAAAERIQGAARDLADSGRKARTVEELVGDHREPAPVDVAALAGRAVERARESFPGADIRRSLPESAPVVAVEGFDRAVTEAIENAVVHGEGPVEVAIDPGADHTELTVTDRGPGLPAHEREVLAEAGETALQHGSGVGLWLMKWLADRAGGRLAFRQPETGGTVVVFELRTTEGRGAAPGGTQR